MILALLKQIRGGLTYIKNERGLNMAGTIRITPEELRTAAGFIKEKQDAMTTDANALKSKIDEIASNWEGAAQSAFISGFTDDMWPVLSKTLPEILTGIEKQLTETANTLEDTDKAISEKLKQ